MDEIRKKRGRRKRLACIAAMGALVCGGAILLSGPSGPAILGAIAFGLFASALVFGG